MNVFVLTHSQENSEDAIIVKNGLLLSSLEKKDREIIVEKMFEIKNHGKHVSKAYKVFVYSYKTKYLIEFQTRKRDRFNRTLPVMVYIEGIDNIESLQRVEFTENIKKSITIANIDDLDCVNKGVDFINDHLKKKQIQKKIAGIAISVFIISIFIWIIYPTSPPNQFDIPIKYEDQLNNLIGKDVPPDLKKIFENNRNELSKDAQIEKVNTTWLVTDPSLKDFNYVIKKDEKKGGLHVEKTKKE